MSTALYAVLGYFLARDGLTAWLARTNRLTARLGPETPKIEAARRLAIDAPKEKPGDAGS